MRLFTILGTVDLKDVKIILQNPKVILENLYVNNYMKSLKFI